MCSWENQGSEGGETHPVEWPKLYCEPSPRPGGVTLRPSWQWLRGDGASKNGVLGSAWQKVGEHDTRTCGM